ncbi:MAG: cupin domain-containing protein [Planctomycetes bacterium]|nr:cupin domain-containing protein [Planctomycetota bacterium]
MNEASHHVVDLAGFQEVPTQGTLSRTLYSDDRIKAIWFGFAAGEELSEHTASMPAILHFLQGEARLTLGDEVREARPGTWVYMRPNLPHSIKAKTPVVMLLTLIKT